jgi:hypothetical protein
MRSGHGQSFRQTAPPLQRLCTVFEVCCGMAELTTKYRDTKALESPCDRMISGNVMLRVRR